MEMHGQLFELAANWPASKQCGKEAQAFSAGVISNRVGGIPYITSGIAADRRLPEKGHE